MEYGKMQGRTGSTGLELSEESKDLLPTHVSQKSRAQAKRNWSLGKFSNVRFFFVLLLCSGLLLGVVTSLHVIGYFNGGKPLVSLMQPANPSKFWLTPGGFYHTMTDEELLWRASIVPQRPGLPVQREKKIAFMFLTKGPMSLAPLWERYFKGHKNMYTIYVHAAPGSSLEVRPSSVFYGRQIPSQETSWGNMNIIDAERRLLANALLDFSNERFVLLSESCIPVYNFTTYYNAMIDSKVSFVGAFDDPSPVGRGRWTWDFLPEVEEGLWRKGAQWFEVKRKHAIYLVSDVKYYQKFRDFCLQSNNHPCYGDEHYIPTTLTIAFAGELSNTSITYTDWSRGGSHPATFNQNDMNEWFIQRIVDEKECLLNEEENQPCNFFARKFSPNALKPLLELAPKVMGIN